MDQYMLGSLVCIILALRVRADDHVLVKIPSPERVNFAERNCMSCISTRAYETWSFMPRVLARRYLLTLEMWRRDGGLKSRKTSARYSYLSIGLLVWKTLTGKYQISITILYLNTLLTTFKAFHTIFFSIMYLLLLFVFAAISAAVAIPVPADEAHREKPLSFSLGKDNPPSTADHELVQHDQTLSDADSYGTTSNKHQIPSGVTSEYPVGDMHLPLQATKALNPAIVNALQDTSLHIPKESYMDEAWWYPGKNADDGGQPDSKCGGSKSVCCMKGWTWDISVVKTCRHGSLLPLRWAYITDN